MGSATSIQEGSGHLAVVGHHYGDNYEEHDDDYYGDDDDDEERSDDDQGADDDDDERNDYDSGDYYVDDYDYVDYYVDDDYGSIPQEDVDAHSSNYREHGGYDESDYGDKAGNDKVKVQM